MSEQSVTRLFHANNRELSATEHAVVWIKEYRAGHGGEFPTYEEVRGGCRARWNIKISSSGVLRNAFAAAGRTARRYRRPTGINVPVDGNNS